MRGASAGAAVAARAGMLRLASCVALTTIAACATDPTLPEEDARGFEIEPGVFVPLGPVDQKADLPNGGFQPRSLDTSGYRAIANIYASVNTDLRMTGALASYDWPLTDSRAVLNREGTPIRLVSEVYEHTGLDVIRASETESPVVHAPTSGYALITDWWGTQQYPSGDYSTVISIWDPVTHHILELMHVRPDATLPRNQFFVVQRGQAIGELAAIDIPGGRHTHVNVVDAEHFVLIDPATVMPSYGDTTKPVIGDVYLLDDLGLRTTVLRDGAFDVVVTASDRDDASPRNLEIESIAVAAFDQTGTELGRLGRCRLDDAFEQLAFDWTPTASTIRLIDFGYAIGQFGGFWPNSDLGNPDRVFRYAATNLRLDASGRCSIVANDRDGQMVVTPATTALTFVIDVWDVRGNLQTKQVTLTRAVPPPPVP